MKFITKCCQCGDQNDFKADESDSIQLYFYKGTTSSIHACPDIFHKMVIYCENCGNKEERGIDEG